MTIFIDLDGILVDFVGGVHKRLGLPYNPAEYPYVRGKYQMLESIAFKSDGEVTKSDVCDACDCSCFWENLEWEPNGQRILHAALKTGAKIYICTAPMLRPGAWSGKAKWVQKNLGSKVQGLIVTSAPKSLLARSNHLLIDDKDTNVSEFIAEGGFAYLVAQPWNSRHKDVGTDWFPELEELLQSTLAKYP